MDDTTTNGKSLHFAIQTLWNGDPISHDPLEFRLSADPDGGSVRVDVSGPLFNDPGLPLSPAGKPCDELWEYEVAEVFFLGEKDRYLEVEFCPHGQHLVLLLDGCRNMFKDKLDLEYTAIKNETNKRWTGSAHIPMAYFPPSVNKLNAYAIHGSGENRQYEALYPATKDFNTPDFHRLQFFKPFDFKSMFPGSWAQSDSAWWKNRNNKI